ncbi:hypothetical protein D046_1200B, partial [Vibrio parahaemolyticus V-223/04]
VSNY